MEPVNSLIINFPKMGKVSWVVLAALEDALGYMFESGDEFFSENPADNYPQLQHLNDQFSTDELGVSFDGVYEERIAFAKDPHSCFAGYQKEMSECMVLLGQLNDSHLLQKTAFEKDMRGIRRYPNHWVLTMGPIIPTGVGD